MNFWLNLISTDIVDIPPFSRETRQSAVVLRAIKVHLVHEQFHRLRSGTLLYFHSIDNVCSVGLIRRVLHDGPCARS